MFNTIKPFCKGHVLEVGCGIGNTSKLLIKNRFQTTLSDYSDQYFDILRREFSDNGKVDGIHKINVATENFESVYPDLINKFDTIIAMNVVEHIYDDHLTSPETAEKCLRRMDIQLFWCRHYQALFNAFDKELVHFRRYTKKTLTKLLRMKI